MKCFYSLYWPNGIGIGSPTCVFASLGKNDRKVYLDIHATNWPDKMAHFNAVSRKMAEKLIGKKKVEEERKKTLDVFLKFEKQLAETY